MILIESRHLDKINAIGLCFFIFIVVHPDLDKYTKMDVINHEKIHYRQQLELLFIGQWILYGLFQLIYGYKNNPFELEANEYERNYSYLRTRKAYKWIKYL